jgi:predicted dehydrogenase
MSKPLRIAVVGLDTSHSIEFIRRFQAPDCPADQQVPGAVISACLSFETPFQNQEGLAKRQAQLEGWGVKVTRFFDEAVADCDAIMLEINDPAYHAEYFARVAGLGKPVFVDKPMAGTVADGQRMLELAARHGTQVMSCSSLRFATSLADALGLVPDPRLVNCYGAMGIAPAGDSLVWYGVHAFEMLHLALGGRASQVSAIEVGSAIVSAVEYPDGRQGLVECRPGSYVYGGRLQGKDRVQPFLVDSRYTYRDLLRSVIRFFNGAAPAATLQDAFEILELMQASRKSLETGKAVTL